MSIRKTKYKVCATLNENLWSSSKISGFKRKKWSKLNKVKLQQYCPEEKNPVHLQSSVFLYRNRLKAKQKLKNFYGNTTEKTFRSLYKKSILKDNFVGLLESRLDSIVLRMNFAPTPFAAGQMISHKMFLVNGRFVNTKGTLLKPGDCIEVSNKAWLGLFGNIESRFTKEAFIRPVPNYLEVNYSLLKGIFLYEPKITEVPYSSPMNIDLVKEFYK
jgi:small subunit ribosomal protein S4